MLRPGEQDPDFEPRGDLAAERAEYENRAFEAATWYRSLSDRTCRQMRELEVRCPSHGCGLAEVIRLPLPGGGERFLFLGYTRKGTAAGFLNWAFSDDWYGPDVWFPVACRHGNARLERAWLLDCLDYINGWTRRGETVEQMRLSASDTVLRGLRSGVFHPEPAVWRARSAQPRPGKLHE